MPHPADKIALTSAANQIMFAVKAVPGASRTRIVGEWNGALRIAVAAPPEDGKANDELVEFLADAMQIKRAAITILRGHSHRQKTMAITGVALVAMKTWLRTVVPAKGGS